MNYNHPTRNSSTTGVHLMCAIVFACFSFCWLYFFQQDLLAMAQHVLSGGITHYNRLIGAIVVTGILLFVQMLVFRLSNLNRRMHALTYGLSFILLGVLSDIAESDEGGITRQTSWWFIIFILLAWLGTLLMARYLQKVEDNDNAGFFSRTMWLNLMMMFILMTFVPWIGNTNAVFHYRMKVEQCLKDGEYDEALMVGKKSLESDEHLTMLRMFTLAKKGELGEHLFEYPISGNSSKMLPTDSTTCMMLCPEDTIYRFFGARPGERLTPARYLELIQRRDVIPEKAVHDYQLCGMLIDKDLDRFVANLGKYYTVNDSLPKHYREALTLYTRSRSNPLVVYHNSVMDEDYNNLLELEKQYPMKSERMGKVEEHYRGTYWYYYRYE